MNYLRRNKSLQKDIITCVVLAVLGVVLKNINLSIPNTPAVVEISSLCIFLGIVLYKRKYLVIPVMLVISSAVASDLTIIEALKGNLLYFIPFTLFMYALFMTTVSRMEKTWLVALVWGIGILAGYQLFTTPGVWFYTGVLQDSVSLEFIWEGIKQQPFLMESALVAIISASIVLVHLNGHIVKANRKRLLTILNNLSDGVIVTDVDLNIELMNPVAEKITNMKLNEAKGKPLQEVYKSSTLKKEDDLFEQLFEDKNGGLHFTGKISRKDEQLMLRESFSHIKSDEEKHAGVIITFNDITKEKKKEKELKEKIRETEILLNAAIGREKKMKELKEKFKEIRVT